MPDTRTSILSKKKGTFFLILTATMLFTIMLISDISNAAGPALGLSGNTGPFQPGQSITFSGTGFSPDSEIVSFLLYDENTFLDLKHYLLAPAPTATDGGGGFTATAALPSGLASGDYTAQVYVWDAALGGELTTSTSLTLDAAVDPSIPTLSFVNQPPSSLAGSQTFSVSAEMLWGGSRIPADDSIIVELISPYANSDLALDGTTEVQAVDGLAAFSQLSLSGSSAQGLQLRVRNLSNPSMTLALSQPFDYTASDGGIDGAWVDVVPAKASYQPGEEITLTGSGFDPASEIVSFRLTTDDDPEFIGPNVQDMTPYITSGSLTLDENGAFTITAALPANLGAGTYLVEISAVNEAAMSENTHVIYLSVGTAAPAALILAFAAEPPAAVKAGDAFTVSVEVMQDNQRIATTDTIALEAVTLDAGNAPVLQGNTEVQAVDGLAVFTGISLSGTPVENLRLRARNISNPAADTALSQPFRLAVSELFLADSGLVSAHATASKAVQATYQVQVNILDVTGQIDSTAVDTLAAELAAVTFGGPVVLAGDTQVQAVQGAALFDNIYLTGPAGSMVTLEISSLSTGDIAPINIPLGPLPTPAQVPSALAVTVQPSASVSEGAVFQVEVQLVDENGSPLLEGSPAALGGLDYDLVLPQEAAAAGARLGSSSAEINGHTGSVSLSVQGGVGNGFRLQLSDPSHPELPPVLTDPFEVSGPAAVQFAQLPPELAGTGQYLIAGQPLGLGDVVAVVYDQDGTLYQGPIDISVNIHSSGNYLGFGGIEGTTTVTAVGGIAVFDDLTINSNYAAHELLLSAYPQNSVLYGEAQDYQWVTAADSPTFNLLVPRLLFTNEDILQSGPANAAVWHDTLPAAGAGDTGPFQLPYSFAGVQWTLPDYHTGEPLRLSGDAAGKTGFTVDASWILKLSARLPDRQELLVGTVSGSGPAAAAVDLTKPAQLVNQGLTVTGELASLSQLPAGHYGMELVLNSSASENHYGTDSIYLLAGRTAEEREKPLTNARKPLRIGADTLSVKVGEEISIPVSIVSAPEPFTGMAVHFDYDPEAIEIKGFDGAPGFGARTRLGRNGVIQLWPDWNTWNGPLAEGDTVFNIRVRGLSAGNWPISFVGNSAGWGFGNESSLAFQRTIGDTITVKVYAPDPIAEVTPGDVVIDPEDGTVKVNITGNQLDAASSVRLITAAGEVAAATEILEVSENGALLTAFFEPTPAPVPANIYSISVLDAQGQTLAEGEDLLVAPAVPILSMYRDDVHPQIPGKPATHVWRLENTGSVDAVAIALFGFKPYLAEPQLELDASPDGTKLLLYGQTGLGWLNYVAVPVKAGSFVNIPWTVVLPPEAVFGADAQVGVGDPVPFFSVLTGALTTKQWETLGSQLSGQSEDTFNTTALAQGSELWKRNMLAVLDELGGMSPEHLTGYAALLAERYPEMAAHLFDEGNIHLYKELLPVLMGSDE